MVSGQAFLGSRRIRLRSHLGLAHGAHYNLKRTSVCVFAGDVIDQEPETAQGDGKLLDKNQGYISFKFVRTYCAPVQLRPEAFAQFLFCRNCQLQGHGRELFISQLDDGRLNLRELFLTGTEEPDRISPNVRGDIDEQPDFYNVQEIRGIASGDMMQYEDRRDPLEHVLISRIASQDPYRLDFKHTYSFNCTSEDFYRVTYTAVGDAEECDHVVLRFQVAEDRFLLQSEEERPDSNTLYRKWDNAAGGLPHEHLDYPPPPKDDSVDGRKGKAAPLHPAITPISATAVQESTTSVETSPEMAAMESGSGSIGVDPDGGGIGLSEEALIDSPEDPTDSIDVPPADIL